MFGFPTESEIKKIIPKDRLLGRVGLLNPATATQMAMFNADVSFGGTSIIIIVGVILETMQQVESMMVVRHYRGFLSD